MSSVDLPSARAGLARRVRTQFVARIESVLDPLATAIGERLLDLVDKASSTRQAHERRDAALEYQRLRERWVSSTRQAMRRAADQVAVPTAAKPSALNLELIGDDVVEKKIVASRLAMAIGEKASLELNDLRVRMEAVEGEGAISEDILKPESLAMLLIDQWLEADLSRQTWLMVPDVIQQHVVPAAVEAYKQVNEALVQAGVLPSIDHTQRVRRGGGGRRAGNAAAAASGGGETSPAGVAGAAGGEGPNSNWGGLGAGGGAGAAGAGGSPGGSWGGGGSAGTYVPGARGGNPGGSGGFGGVGAGGYAGDSGAFGAAGARLGAAGGAAGASNGAVPGSAAAAAGDSSVPSGGLARVRAGAQGLIGQLRRLLVERVQGFDFERGAGLNPALTQAMTVQQTHLQTQVQGREQVSGGEVVIFDNAAVREVARDLREQTGELKRQAATSGEKAVIEIVALMFQSILAEERIPPAVRVWFARLQMPVLRLALSEPEFFGSLQHPARMLIDRMGSVVLGFDAASISGTALEAEIRRVVQVIEQYPETGRRVFELAYGEFQKFLERYLTESGAHQRLVTVAQQVEQKETMAVRYTIELRKMLEDMPVRDEIRQFLFKVWAEVLAVAAVKNGPQHEETLALKKSASELVWAASAKPNKAERAQVIQGLPALLQRLRQGMSLMGVDAAEQEAHIKTIGDTLADAFQAKTAAIPPERIDAIARRLANIEDFVGEDPEGDLPLVAESIEMMLGIDSEGIEVVTDGGVRPSAAMQAWARELQPGNWFSLDHNGQVMQVQYAWRSERGQLHLFAAPTGRSYLFQAGRLAAYLEAGLVTPTEEETLTVRATRDALAKLDANPERLLS